MSLKQSQPARAKTCEAPPPCEGGWQAAIPKARALNTRHHSSCRQRVPSCTFKGLLRSHRDRNHVVLHVCRISRAGKLQEPKELCRSTCKMSVDGRIPETTGREGADGGVPRGGGSAGRADQPDEKCPKRAGEEHSHRLRQHTGSLQKQEEHRIAQEPAGLQALHLWCSGWEKQGGESRSHPNLKKWTQ